MTDHAESETASEQLQRIHAALEGGRALSVKRSLHSLHPAEIALLVESLPRSERAVIWNMVDTDDRGEVLLHLTEGVREDLVQHMDVADLVAAAKGLPIDDLADFVENLPETVTQQVLRAMDTRDRDRLEQVLAYEPDTAGGLMSPDIVTVRPDVTLDVVTRYLRMRGRLWATTDMMFVVDRYNRYLGSLPLAKVLTREPEMLVSTVMDRADPLRVTQPSSEVAQRFENLDLISAPVVDEHNHLVGRITIDDVVDVIRHESEHRLMSMAGLQQDEDIFAPVSQAARRRAVWLGINLATAFMASWVVGMFEAAIEQVVALAVLMPIVASMGGIGGSQVLTLMIRSLALGQIGSANISALLKKEIQVALINGVLWALVVGLVTLWWFNNWGLAMVIAVALLLNQLNGCLSGVYLPLFLKKIGVDPALAGSVILTTFTDVGGFFALLGLGSLILL
ncbi:MAG TPA: magnesium transporter [Verrucomicrobiae bacterium]|nr:magnesium transporter [Verrucomicrobiae bacterium]